MQWRALGAGTLGWALDAFDTMLYPFALTAIMAEWGTSPAAAGGIVTVTLVASSLGGVAFGALADRIGRARTLTVTVLWFSLFSGLSALAQDLWQLGAARALLGVGMGGEWAAGALLVSETWPARHRGKAIGLMQSGWAVGYFLAAVAALLLPAVGWRWLFVAGLLPALFTLWVRAKVKEPEVWLRSRAAPGATPPGTAMAGLFRPPLLRPVLLATLTSACVMSGYWGLFSWLPSFLALPVEQGGAGLGLARAPAWVMPSMVGAFFGYITFGFAADRVGRRPAFAAWLCAAAVLVWTFGQTRDQVWLLVLGPFVGFFGSGYFSAFGAFIAELFPTAARGAAVGLCYNGGRLVSAFAPPLIGAASGSLGLGGALALLSLAFLAGAGSMYLLPETRGRELG